MKQFKQLKIYTNVSSTKFNEIVNPFDEIEIKT